MEVNNAFVNGLFLLAGIVLSSAINYYMVKRERKWKESLRDIKMLAKQCESFWHLEQSYLLYISMKDSNEKMKSVQRKRRSMLNLNPKLEKIVINPSSINKLLAKWDITNQ